MKTKQWMCVCSILMLLISLFCLPAYGEASTGKEMEMYLSNHGDGAWELGEDCPDDIVRISSYDFIADDDENEIVYCFTFRGMSPGQESVILKWMRNGSVYMYIDMVVLVDENLQPSITHFEFVPGTYWEDESWTEVDPDDEDWY